LARTSLEYLLIKRREGRKLGLLFNRIRFMFGECETN
jgi:hypothetical protein